MARFDAGTAVDTLDYDFKAYGGSVGTIHEPSTGSVNRFFKNMKAMVKEVNALNTTVKDLKVEELSDEELESAMVKMDEAEAGASVYQTRSIEYIAELCGATRETVEDPENPGRMIEVVNGGTPSVDDLTLLPYRVLQAFSTWLVGEIRPKKAPTAGPA